MSKLTQIEQLFKAHYARMFRLALALLHDADLARDIVHDVFASLLDSDHKKAVTPGYLLAAVRNRCLNYIRDCEIRKRIAGRYFLDNSEYDAEDWPDEETIGRLNNMIETDISPSARAVIRLRFREEMPFAQVAREMGISQSAVFRHLSRALSIIRNKLNDNG